jgi:hypothetical protein
MIDEPSGRTLSGTRSVNVGDVIQLSLPYDLSLYQASERMPDFSVYY